MSEKEDNYFTFGGSNNDNVTVYYKDLPKETLSKLDQSIKLRAVHIKSVFGVAALKGGYDPEKVSTKTLVSEGLLDPPPFR